MASPKQSKRTGVGLIGALVLVLLVWGLNQWLGSDGNGVTNVTGDQMGKTQDTAANSNRPDNDSDIDRLFAEQASDVAVTGQGRVSRLLSDDHDGDRHQRFILTIDSGLTLLVAHNIDVAPRVDGLSIGDTVLFHGEYIYSEQGGTIHWTHHDPQGKHDDGWLRWQGQSFS
ncbi:MAG: DUF3465 domain-containing protein [Propionibacteriaceae bacterium]|jgi:hypothetical protein|nr:DUF3465 domain-containing protein [Propionibacteriaceae bacterium]